MLIRFSSHSRQATALTFSYGYFIAVLVKLYRSETAILHVNFQEGLNGVYWQMVKTYNWQPTNTRKINRQLIFVVRFAGNLQKEFLGFNEPQQTMGLVQSSTGWQKELDEELKNLQ